MANEHGSDDATNYGRAVSPGESADVAYSALLDLASLSDDELPQALAGHRDFVSPRHVERLIAHAHTTLGSDPRKATRLARLATAVAAALRSPEVDAMEAVRLEGDAWREYASALIEANEYHAARGAIRQAGTFYGIDAARFMRELAILGLLEGRLLHILGDSEHGLLKIEQNGNWLKAFCEDAKMYVKARTIYAYILLEMLRYEEALEVFEQAAELAREEEDGETLVYILNNVGLCNLHLGDHERAPKCFEVALRMFEDLGLRQEMPRVRFNMAHILIARGRYNEAISEFYKSRAEFLRLDLPVDAAGVGLLIASALFLAGRPHAVPALCEEMIATFMSAGLPHEARKALAYLAEANRHGGISSGDVEHVRAFFDRLRDDPAVAFEPPPPHQV